MLRLLVPALISLAVATISLPADPLPPLDEYTLSDSGVRRRGEQDDRAAEPAAAEARLPRSGGRSGSDGKLIPAAAEGRSNRSRVPASLASHRTQADSAAGRSAGSQEPESPEANGGSADPAATVDSDDGGEDEESPEEEEGEDDEEEADEEAETLLSDAWHRVGPISVEYLYTGEVFHNARGGMSTQQATRYRGNLDIALSLDTEEAGWWCRGEFFIYLQHSHGRTLTQDYLGDGQFYSNIDTSPKSADLTQLGEYWYQHRSCDDRSSLRIGRLDPNADFAYADLGGDFVNSSFVTLPNIPMPYWPFQTLGVSALHQVNPRLRVGGGVYDNGADLAQWWVTTASRGMFFVGQADWQPWAECEDALPTLVRCGGWFTSSDTEALDGSGPFEGNFGFYATLDQMLAAEMGDPEQGLGGFCQFSWAAADRNMVDVGYGAGLVYRGLLPCRDADTLGAAFSVIEFSSVLRDQTGQTYENTIEVFYKARLPRGVALQPDVQYLVSPSGQERDAVVVGLRFEAAF